MQLVRVWRRSAAPASVASQRAATLATRASGASALSGGGPSPTERGDNPLDVALPELRRRIGDTGDMLIASSVPLTAAGAPNGEMQV